MAYNQQQQTSGANYFCCGNPWDDIFGSTENEVQPQQKAQPQAQDWNNPFNNTYQTYNQADEVRSYDSQPADRGDGDVRSVGSRKSTGSQYSRNSNLTGKSLADIEREDQARARAMYMQEQYMADGSIARSEGASVLTDDRLAVKHMSKQTYRDPEVSAKTSAVNRAVQALQQMKLVEKKVSKTETTRPKKEMTPEDVRDPETVTGMKCKVDITLEEEAKKKGLQMISNGEYPYDEHKGTAIWSTNSGGVNKVTRRAKGNVSEIV